MLTHRFVYPPNRGDRIRSYNLLKVLSEHYRVTLACTTDEPISPAERQHAHEFCESVLIVSLHRGVRLLSAAAATIRGGSLTAGMFHSHRLWKQIQRQQQSQPFDVVLVFCSSMFPYVDNCSFEETPVIVDLVDVDSAKWTQMGHESGWSKRPIYRMESNRVRKLEQRIADRANAVALVSDQEADLFRRTVTTATTPVRGVSNGVDTEYFAPPLSTRTPTTARNRSEAICLVFTGVLDYAPNVEGIVWFCREVLPQLPPQLEIQLSIVGRRPNARVLALDNMPQVEVVGEVPDVRPYLHRADIAISPLKLARGIQNKVLEAMACGLPVILSRPSAEGITAESEREFVIADTVDQWCHAITRLGQDGAARTRIGAAARDLVVDQYSWPARLAGLVDLLSEQIEPTPPARQ